MSQKFNKTKEFIALNKKWQKKLEKSGFVDIEQDEDNLINWSDQFFRQKSLDSYQAKEAYYRMATHFLHDYEFDNKLERTIWEYHAEGISMRNIARTLAKVKIKINPNKVCDIIKALRTNMYNLYNNGSNE